MVFLGVERVEQVPRESTLVNPRPPGLLGGERGGGLHYKQYEVRGRVVRLHVGWQLGSREQAYCKEWSGRCC